MPTLTRPILPDGSGPDLPDGVVPLSYTLNPDGETYTVEVVVGTWLSVPAWRVRATADILGLTASIDAALDALPEPTRTAARAAWNQGDTMERHNKTVVALGAAIGLTEAEMDDVFRQAAALDV